MPKNFIYKNLPYLILLFFGALLLTNESELNISIHSRILERNDHEALKIEGQYILGLLTLFFSIYKILRNR